MKNDSHADNDNEPLSFTMLAALTANVTRYLNPDKQENENPSGKPDAGSADKKRSDDNRAYVDQRLKEITAWERKISGGKI
jgi:hypothetical protein